jgi:UDP-glucose 4-epimerase
MMDILITGAAGFIGANLARALKGNNLFLLQHSKKVDEDIEGKRINFDLTSPLKAAELPGRLDIIIHEAALIGSDQQDRGKLKRINVDGTKKLLNYAKKVGVKKFLFASTAAVYGSGDKPFREEDPLRPNSPYAESKLEAEKEVLAFSRDFTTLIFRYYHPYGQGQEKPRIISRIIDHVVNGQSWTVYNHPHDNPRTDPIYIDDLVTATIKSFEIEESQIINLGGLDVVSLKKIAEIAGVLLEKTPRFEFVDDLRQQDLVVDKTRMKKLLVSPKIGVEEGIKRVLGKA